MSIDLLKEILKSKVGRIIKHPKTPFGAVLCFHSFGEQDNGKLWANESLKFSAASLEQLIVQAKNHGCTFVSLDEVHDILVNRKPARKVIAITIDDGYQNNCDIAAPIFQKHTVPYCINIATDLIDGNLLQWWYLLEEIIQQNNTVVLPDGQELVCNTQADKETAFQTLSSIFGKLNHDDIREAFMSILSQYVEGIDLSLPKGMTWDTINELKEDSNCTFGNHTVSHPSLKQCSLESVSREINTAQNRIKEMIGLEMIHFAYPYGSFTPETQEIAQELTFKTIQTIEPELLRYNYTPISLPRFMVNEHNWEKILERVIYTC